jgi:3-oxoacyl-[acyl-carrier protein] reductase
MDLGIDGRKAIVCASSMGLGFACARALTLEGVEVVLNARHAEPLESAAARIAEETGGRPAQVVADVTTPEGRAALLEACPEPDILVNNCGGPPAGNIREFGLSDWNAALNANMLSAIDLICSTMDGMMARGFGRVVSITSVAVKAPIAGLDLSNGARAGLTGVVAGLARTTVKRNVTMNNLLPGTFKTRRIDEYYRKMAGLDPEADMEAMIAADLSAQPSGRFGDPEELGRTCAFLCSVYAGYINGQNIALDGGEFRGAL